MLCWKAQRIDWMMSSNINSLASSFNMPTIVVCWANHHCVSLNKEKFLNNRKICEQQLFFEVKDAVSVIYTPRCHNTKSKGVCWGIFKLNLQRGKYNSNQVKKSKAIKQRREKENSFLSGDSLSTSHSIQDDDAIEGTIT